MSIGFYFGGEVELQFSTAGSLFISLDENAGSPDHFSLRFARESVCIAGTLERFGVSTAPLWGHHICQTLETSLVPGWGSILIGDRTD